MKRMLGKKQKIKNEDWINAMKNIEDLISIQELEIKVKETVEDIRKMTDGKKAAYAWSAGKDSIVLGAICQTGKSRNQIYKIRYCSLGQSSYLPRLQGYHERHWQHPVHC